MKPYGFKRVGYGDFNPNSKHERNLNKKIITSQLDEIEYNSDLDALDELAQTYGDYDD